MRTQKLTLAYARQLAQQCFEQHVRDGQLLQGNIDDLAGHIFDSGMNETYWYDAVKRTRITLQGLFDWEDSEQGYDFWDDIDEGSLIPPHK